MGVGYLVVGRHALGNADIGCELHLREACGAAQLSQTFSKVLDHFRLSFRHGAFSKVMHLR
jgi:hypothetical protein